MKRLLYIIKKSTPLLLGLGVIYYSYQLTGLEERTQVFRAIEQANFFWVVVSMFLGVLAYFVRALRWDILLRPLGYRIALIDRFCAVMIGYVANLGIPRSGEFLRVAVLSNQEKGQHFQSIFSTIIFERIFDFFMLILIFACAFFCNAELISDYLEIHSSFPYRTFLYTILGMVVIIVLIKWLKPAVFEQIRGSIKTLLQTLKEMIYMPKKGLFFAYLLLIWALYLSMFWVVKYSISELTNLNADAMLIAFVAGGISISFTNEGIGVFPLAVAFALSYYGIAFEYGTAAGWILWLTQATITILLGSVSYLVYRIRAKSKKITIR